MPLNGVNKVCAQCKKDCKQFFQVKVIRCPLRQPIAGRDIQKEGTPKGG